MLDMMSECVTYIPTLYIALREYIKAAKGARSKGKGKKGIHRKKSKDTTDLSNIISVY